MVIEMGKRFYILLFVIMSASGLLLSLSYASESGRNDEVALAEINKDEYRVIFSNSKKVDTKDNNKIEFGIINKSDEINNFALVLNSDDKVLDDLYYSINNGSKEPVTNGMINLGEVQAFGTEGDFNFYSIEISSNNDYEFNLDVLPVDVNLLSSYIKRSKQVYLDSVGNIRYYGENVNNYLNYNNHLYRIIGIVDGKIKLLDTTDKGLGIFNVSDQYPSLDDYLSSFTNRKLEVNEVLNKRSWMTEIRDYWLVDNNSDNVYGATDTDGVISVMKNVGLYRRNVVILDDIYNVSNGDGTILHPYEVTYGS